MQRRLSEYLQYEMYHVVGAYGVAQRKLEELERRLREAGDDTSDDRDDGHNALLKLTSRAAEYNAALGDTLHAAGVDVRHPIPSELPLSRHERFDIAPDAADLKNIRDNPWKGPMEWSWVLSFYDAAIHLLERRPGSGDTESRTLVGNLISARDVLASGRDGQQQNRERRLERFKLRRVKADEHLRGAAPSAHDIGRAPLDDIVNRVATNNLSLDSDGSLPYFVIKAQAEAHLAMHAVEAWQSMPLGKHASRVAGQGQWLDSELDRCIVLGTFAYCVARSAPWIFAEDPDECRYVFENFQHCWRNVVPTRCMWLAGQVSLLALHRRAYARALKGDSTGAYNDYHKLHRQIRDARRRIHSAPIQVEGANAFLVGLDAQAHHHIGELYRAEHAHKPAVKHFRSASHGLEILAKDKEMNEVLVNSRWHVQLQVSQGKASYELGQHKMSLCWHLRGWRECLRLLAADTGTAANVEETTKAIKWLTEVRYEPELLKSEIREYVGPVVKQLDGIVVPDHLGGLAADILLRLGHLLFVLNIGRDADPPAASTGDKPPTPAERRAAEQQVSRTMAFKCLTKAAQCDRRNTLVGADMLKSRLRFRSWFGGALPTEYGDELMPQELEDVRRHWPGGSDDYENLARIAEYLMLRAQLHGTASDDDDRPPPGGEQRDEADIARALLTFFFMHTDSINVRKSQVHTFLMRPRKTKRPRDQAAPPAIEFISMRRYSSAFPLLPRPSTFRALGGGYFVRLHGKSKRDVEWDPFGVVVDPGVDFIENLYRTGYSLSDIDMIVVTHDHVDHLGSLDPLLSLLYEHTRYRDKQRANLDGDPFPKPVIYASRSILDRYRNVKWLMESNEFRDLADFLAAPGVPPDVTRWPGEFEMVSMSSKSFDDDEDGGHPDLSDQPALGVCIRAARGPSIAIASDTPCPPDRDSAVHASWHDEWKPALDADVLVCHLSTVPLTELRKLARIDASRQPLRHDDRIRIEAMARSLSANASKVLDTSTPESLDPFETSLIAIQVAADAIATVTADVGVLVHVVDELVDEIDMAVGMIVQALETSEFPPDLPRAIYDVVDEAKTLIEEVEQLPHDVGRLARARRELQAARPGLKDQIEFGLWLGSHRPLPTSEEYTADLLREVDDRWRPPPQHSYLLGTIRWAREYKRQRRRRGSGLLVIGELSEELGTVRSKVAMQLNEKIFSPDMERERAFSALTSDIGLHVLIGPRSPDERTTRSDARALCTICDLDTDRVPSECFHPAHRICEVCVKGENEGIFYTCDEHDPSTQEDPAFLEQLERFDIFGR